MDTRWIKIDGVENARDLGGLKNQRGEVLEQNQFIRSAGLEKLTETGKQNLTKRGVNTILDLRSTSERDIYPTPIQKKEPFVLLSVPLLDQFNSDLAAGKKIEMPKSMLGIYKYLLKDSGEEYGQVLNYLANASGGSVFHCAVGKDRTGLTAMLLLDIARVSKEDIIADYALSKPLNGAEKKLRKGVPKEILTANPQWMEELFVWIQEHYGSLLGYVESIGVTQKDIGKIRDKFQVS